MSAPLTIRRLAAALAVAAPIAAGASEDMRAVGDYYVSISPAELARVLAGEPQALSLEREGADTVLSGTVDETDFIVFFYECDGEGFAAPAQPDSACLGFEYRAYFPEFTPDIEAINAWMQNHHYGAMWRDEDGDLAVQMNVIVEGGVTPRNIRTTFAWWRATLGAVVEFMEQR